MSVISGTAQLQPRNKTVIYNMESHGDFQSLPSGHGPHELLCGYRPTLPFPFQYSTLQSPFQSKSYSLQLIIFQYRLPENSVTQQ